MSPPLNTFLDYIQNKVQQEHFYILNENVKEVGFIQNAEIQTVSMFIATVNKRYARMIVQREAEIDVMLSSYHWINSEGGRDWRNRCLAEIGLCKSEMHKLSIDIARLRGVPNYGVSMLFGYYIGLYSYSTLSHAITREELTLKKESLKAKERYWQLELGKINSSLATFETIKLYRGQVSEVIYSLQRETQALIIKEYMLKHPARGQPDTIQTTDRY